MAGTTGDMVISVGDFVDRIVHHDNGIYSGWWVASLYKRDSLGGRRSSRKLRRLRKLMKKHHQAEAVRLRLLGWR